MFHSAAVEAWLTSRRLRAAGYPITSDLLPPAGPLRVQLARADLGTNFLPVGASGAATLVLLPLQIVGVKLTTIRSLRVEPLPITFPLFSYQKRKRSYITPEIPPFGICSIESTMNIEERYPLTVRSGQWVTGMLAGVMEGPRPPDGDLEITMWVRGEFQEEHPYLLLCRSYPVAANVVANSELLRRAR